MAAFIGLALGYPGVWVALLLTLVVGVVVTGALVAAKRMDREDPISIGPFLAVGAIATMLFGELNGLEGLGKCSYLIEFYEDRISHSLLNPFLQKLGIGYKDIISDDLDLIA